MAELSDFLAELLKEKRGSNRLAGEFTNTGAPIDVALEAAKIRDRGEVGPQLSELGPVQGPSESMAKPLVREKAQTAEPITISGEEQGPSIFDRLAEGFKFDEDEKAIKDAQLESTFVHEPRAFIDDAINIILGKRISGGKRSFSPTQARQALLTKRKTEENQQKNREALEKILSKTRGLTGISEKDFRKKG